jgi:nucleotide-binding universal stress UspA family protein
MDPLKVVVLTDFSPLARVALNYTLKMSKKLPIEITILNVVRLDGVPKSNMRMKQVEKMLSTIAEEEGAKLLEEVKSKTEAKISFQAIRGHTVSQVVKRYTEKNYVNLVVMGSQGASQLKKLSLGGTTVSLIDSVYSPVLAIPQFAEFKDFSKIVYATDMKDIKNELELLVPFARVFNTKIYAVHVAPSVDKKVEEARILAEHYIGKTGYDKIDFKMIIDEDVPKAIDQYIKDTKSDLLTTFTHELSLFEKLFRLSVTRKLAYQGNLPLLAFKRKK